MTEESGQDLDAIEKAEALLAEGKLEECLSVLKEYWLTNPADARAADLLSRLMSEAGRTELSSKLAKLSEKLEGESGEAVKTKDSSSPQELFEAGYGLIDIRQHELAAMLLNRAATIIPDEPVINYELGFSLMSLGRFKQAVQYFEAALKAQEDFDTRLNLAVCYTMLRRSDDAASELKKLEQLAKGEEEKRELSHRRVVLKRLSTLKGKGSFSLRDWMFVLYGSILINPARLHTKEDSHSIAHMLAALKGVLEGLSSDIEAVEFYSPYSRPLAEILSELMELPMDGYKGPARPDRAILVMSWATDIIGPHQVFTPNQYQRCLFAYGLTTQEPLPLTPDIVGRFREESTMPWTEAVKKNRDVDDMVRQTLAKARDLESDPGLIQAVQEAIDYYDDKRELIVLGNSSQFHERPEYTAELPEEERMS